MKRIGLVVFVWFAVIGLVALFMLGDGPVSAETPAQTQEADATITVCDSGCDFQSIQLAHDASGTVDGATIVVSASVHTESIFINKSIEIHGLGMNETIIQAASEPGVANERVFDIAAGRFVVIRDMIIRHGHRTESSNPNGGGINNHGKLLLKDVIVSNNSANGAGGGIYNAGELHLTHVQVIYNTARQGAAIMSTDYLSASLSIVAANRIAGTGNYGAGIHNSGNGDMYLFSLEMFDNSGARFGGNISNDGYAWIVDTLIHDGHASEHGGGIHNVGSIQMTNSTISGNEANKDGGGLYNRWGSLASGAFVELNNVTITDNTANGSDDGVGLGGGIFHRDEGDNFFKITNSVVAGNHVLHDLANDCFTAVDDTVTATVESVGYNAFGEVDKWCNLAAHAEDMMGTPAAPLDVGLLPLNNNGGASRTHLLMGDSILIDGGEPLNCETIDNHFLMVDQRTFGRNDPRCDIGAVELQLADSTAVSRTLEAPFEPASFGPTECIINITESVNTAVFIVVEREVNGTRSAIQATEPLTWNISATPSDITATVSLCYDDTAFTEDEEATLQLQRWDGVSWVNQPATVDAVENCVTAVGMTEFGRMRLKPAVPTAVQLAGASTPSKLNPVVLVSAVAVGLMTLVAIVQRRGFWKDSAE